MAAYTEHVSCFCYMTWTLILWTEQGRVANGSIGRTASASVHYKE